MGRHTIKKGLQLPDTGRAGADRGPCSDDAPGGAAGGRLRRLTAHDARGRRRRRHARSVLVRGQEATGCAVHGAGVRHGAGDPSGRSPQFPVDRYRAEPGGARRTWRRCGQVRVVLGSASERAERRRGVRSARGVWAVGVDSCQTVQPGGGPADPAAGDLRHRHRHGAVRAPCRPRPRGRARTVRARCRRVVTADRRDRVRLHRAWRRCADTRRRADSA